MCAQPCESYVCVSALEWMFSAVYQSILAQAFLLVIIGSIFRPGERNKEFTWILLVSMSIMVVVSTFTPAIGKVGQLGSGYVDAIHAIRSGAWRVFTYARAEGIVTFPSYHAALAIIFVYISTRPDLRVVAIPFALLNFLMLLSIPPIGGHYLVDLLGGAAVALVSIMTVRVAQTATRGAAGLHAPMSLRR